jgi:hypothetical protein
MFHQLLPYVAAGPDLTAPFFPRHPTRFLIRLLAGLAGIVPVFWIEYYWWGGVQVIGVWLAMGLWATFPRRGKEVVS